MKNDNGKCIYKIIKRRKEKEILDNLNILLTFLLAKNVFFEPLLNYFKIIIEFLIHRV
jgi:hypothetical protein